MRCRIWFNESGRRHLRASGRALQCNEFKRRALSEVSGDHFTVTATEQIAGRLDTKAVKEYLVESCHRFKMAVVSTVKRAEVI